MKCSLSFSLLLLKIVPFLLFEQNFNSEDLKEFDDIDDLTKNKVEELLNKFLEDFKANLVESHGWPTGGSSAYRVAKATLNAYILHCISTVGHLVMSRPIFVCTWEY